MSTVAEKPFQSPDLSLSSGQLPAGFDAEAYGFAFIKSGFEHTERDLVSDFSDCGIDVVGACSVILKPAVVDYIYRDSRQEPFYPAMHKHLVTKPVIAMALHSQGQNTQDTLNDLKFGKNGRPCLRERYAQERKLIPEAEIDAWYRGVHPSQDEVTVQLTQKNVFHAADTSDEAVESLSLLSAHNPEFWAATKRDDPRIRKLARYLTVSQAVLIVT